jgi:hypothetical protein
VADISIDRLREVLVYDPETGIFTWKEKIAKKVVVGKEAGRRRPDGYCRIRLFGVEYYAHRLAVAHHTGEWPVGDLDHANLDRSDNRIANLRLATRSQNQANHPRKSTNTSGFKGVGYFKPSNLWRARIVKDGKLTYQAYFRTKEDAYAAYCQKALELHGEFARVA